MLWCKNCKHAFSPEVKHYKTENAAVPFILFTCALIFQCSKVLRTCLDSGHVVWHVAWREGCKILLKQKNTRLCKNSSYFHHSRSSNRCSVVFYLWDFPYAVLHNPDTNANYNQGQRWEASFSRGAILNYTFSKRRATAWSRLHHTIRNSLPHNGLLWACMTSCS